VCVCVYTHPNEAAAQVGVGHREVGLGDGLLEGEVDDALQPLLGVDGELRHLLHELLELLRGQLVEDAADALEQLLGLGALRVAVLGLLGGAAADGLLGRGLPGLLRLVQLDVLAQRHGGDELAQLFARHLLRAPRAADAHARGLQARRGGGGGDMQ